MFGLRNKGAEPEAGAPASPLGRIGRRNPNDSRGDTSPPPVDRQDRVAAATASLSDAVAPRLRELVSSGLPPGEITRQAGLLIQVHFRSNGVMLAPLELQIGRAHV